MQKKRILALGLSLILTVSTLISGCGQEEQQEQNQQEAQTQTEGAGTETEEAVELEPYTVTFWMYGDESKDNDMVMEEVNKKIQEELPNTTLDVVWVSASEYRDRWNKAMAAGEKIDIGWSANWVNDVENDVSMGVVTPVKDLLEEYGQGIVEAVGGWEVMENHRSADGEMYFIPAWQGMVGGREAIFFKKEIVDLMPEGWLEETQEILLANTDFSAESITAVTDRIEEILEVAKENDLLGNGVNETKFFRMLLPRMLKNDYRVVVTEEDGVFTVDSYYGSEGFKAYADAMRDWYQKGYIRSDVLSADNTLDDTYAIYANQAVPSNWLENECVTQGWDLEGALVCEDNNMITGFATGAVIPITSENPQRAIQVLNLIYTDAEIYQLLVYGIEGTHYEQNSDGTITRPESGSRDYEGAANWTLGTCMNSLAESTAKIGYYEGLKEAEATANEDILLGFVFDSSNVETEKVNIDAVRKEYDKAFYLDNWEETYPAVLEKLDSAGLQTYMDEYKRQLTEYVETNNLGTVAP